jgi:hypothetical protein
MNRLPSPWLLGATPEALTGSNVILWSGGVAWPLANRAYYRPMYFPATVRIASVAIACTATGSGTFDLGIYDETCTNRLQSLGSTALIAGQNTWTLTVPFLLPAGKMVWLAMSCSTVSATFQRQPIPTVGARAMGMGMQATAHPLPSTATPAQISGTTFLPAFGVSFAY